MIAVIIFIGAMSGVFTAAGLFALIPALVLLTDMLMSAGRADMCLCMRNV